MYSCEYKRPRARTHHAIMSYVPPITARCTYMQSTARQDGKNAITSTHTSTAYSTTDVVLLVNLAGQT